MAVVVALLIGATLIAVSGGSPIEAYRELLDGAFGSTQNIATSLTLATTLFFTSLAFTVAFRVGIFNAGTQGQFLMGALSGAWVGFTFDSLPGPAIIAFALVAGVVGGGLWSLVPGLLRERWGVNEIVTTLMLNYVATLLGQYLVIAHFSASGGQVVSSPAIAEAAQLTRLLPPSQLNWALFLGLGAIIAYRMILRSTVLGYEVEMIGKNSRAAKFVGIRTSRLMLGTMVVSGMIAGLGGAQEVLGVHGRYLSEFSINVGLTGIIASLLAQNRPLALVPACILLAGLQNGALNMEIFTQVHRSVVAVVSGLIVMLAAATVTLRWRRPWLQALGRMAAATWRGRLSHD